jgi:hypothetical protein
MKSPTEILEQNLAGFMATLDPDLDDLRRLAPGLVRLLTETALSLFTIEYALRKKGLLAADEVADALVASQDVIERIRRTGLMSVGSA